MCISSCCALSGELWRQTHHWTTLISDVGCRLNETKGKICDPHRHLLQTPSLRNHPRKVTTTTISVSPPPHPSRSLSLSSITSLLTMLPYFSSLRHPPFQCLFLSPSLSLRLNAEVSSKGCQAELLAGPNVPEALKWGVNLKGVYPLLYTAAQRYKHALWLLNSVYSCLPWTSVKAFNKPCVNAKHRSFICRASSALQSMLLL